MRKVIFINGLISGLIVSGMLLINYPLLRNKTLDLDSGMIVGYTSMVIALTLIFFGIKTYRDQYLNGSISFGAAFKVGILITLVASILYASTWQVFSTFVADDFTEFYAETHLNDLKENGATPEEISIAKTELEKWNELYEIPVVRFAMSLMEILPVGIVMTLIAAGILRKRQILPAA